MWDLESFSGLPIWASGLGSYSCSPTEPCYSSLYHPCSSLLTTAALKYPLTIALPCFSPALCCYMRIHIILDFLGHGGGGAQRPRLRNPSVLLGDAEGPEREDGRASPRICPLHQFPTIWISLTCCALLKHHWSPSTAILPWLLGVVQRQFQVAHANVTSSSKLFLGFSD